MFSFSFCDIFIQIIQELPEPGWIVKDYINEKKRGQWQEKNQKIYRQDTETQKYAF